VETQPGGCVGLCALQGYRVRTVGSSAGCWTASGSDVRGGLTRETANQQGWGREDARQQQPMALGTPTSRGKQQQGK
jgi:hypothetical protein